MNEKMREMTGKIRMEEEESRFVTSDFSFVSCVRLAAILEICRQFPKKFMTFINMLLSYRDGYSLFFESINMQI